MNNSAQTREGIRALLDIPELPRLAREHPQGLPDRKSNDRVLRELVSGFQRALAAAGLRLKLRIEPIEVDPKASALSPTRISIFDGDCRWAIPIQTMENAIFVGERLCVTSARADAVQRMAETLLGEIERALGISEGETNG